MSKPKDKKNYTELLPRGTAKKIHEAIGGVISERSILRILTGETEDGYGVLAIAAKMAKDEQKKKEKIANDFALIKLKSTHPLKSK